MDVPCLITKSQENLVLVSNVVTYEISFHSAVHVIDVILEALVPPYLGDVQVFSSFGKFQNPTLLIQHSVVCLV